MNEFDLTERERIHVILRIEHALRESPECEYCPDILRKLRAQNEYEAALNRIAPPSTLGTPNG